jgi:purine-cytosine permease-like protein
MESNQYKPPVRKSLTNEELAARVEYATSTRMGVEAMMDLVVAQEALRAQEDLEIETWLEQMEAEASPASLMAAENFRRTQSGLPELPVVETTSTPEVVLEVVEEVEPEPTAFSWFTKPEPEVSEEPSTSEDVAEEFFKEEVIAEEEVIENFIPEHQEIAVAVAPVGTETVAEFEHLLASAAAEEELTALEDSESISAAASSEDASQNTIIPSDEHRNRKPLSQLLVWLGVSSTIVPMILTWLLISFGLSATAIVADLALGYFVAGVVIATASLAGKRSGLSTSIVTRAVFGVWGNAIPGTIVYVVRVVVAGLLLAFTGVLMNGTETGLPDLNAQVTSLGGFDLKVGLVASAIAVIIVGALALIRGTASRVLQLALSVSAFVALLFALIGIFGRNLGFISPGIAGLGSKESLLGFALVVVVVTVLWVAIAPNLAKSIPMAERGLKVFSFVLAANFVVPAFVAVASLSWLGPRATQLAVSMPLDLSTLSEIVMELPRYSRIALLVSVALTIAYALLLTLKSAVLDLAALIPVKRVSSVLLTVFSTLLVIVLFAMQPANFSVDYLVNVLTLVAALSAGWIGMLVSDVALRRIAYHELSLSRSYGFYKRFSIISITAWLVTVIAALALMPVHLKGLGFTGFGDESIGFARDITTAPVGFIIVVAFGAVLTLAVRIPEIRKQEREVLQVESRREQLNNIFLGQE